jgi:hypothetical protein
MAAKLKIEKRGDEIKKKSSPLKLLSQSQPNFAEMILGWSSSKFVSGISEHRLGRGPSKDHSTKVLLQLAQWFLRRRFICEFPLGSYEMAKTALFKARVCPNLNCISIMMRFLKYMTGFFMNFELLPILTDYAN